jgi:sarcosine oxidase
MGPEGAPRVDRTVAAHEVASIRAHLATHLPWAEGILRQTAVCTYTTTPDEHFLIDRAPDTDRVWLASPCSGHGFKFASAIGEALADLVTDVTPACDLTPFRLGRFGS